MSGCCSKPSPPASRRSGADPDRQRAKAADEVGIEPDRLACDFDPEAAREDLLPQDAYLHLRQPVADAAMDAGAERQMLPGLGATEDKALGILDRLLVAVAGDVPHDDLAALGDALAAQLRVGRRRAPHMDHRRLVADYLRHQAGQQARIAAHLVVF